MLKKEPLLKNITFKLSLLRTYIEFNNFNDLTDVNKFSEGFFAGLINKIHDLQLKNMNLIKSNFPAIDIGDANSRICYQVTSENGIQKIEETIKKFEENELYKQFDELNILILSKKLKYRKKLTATHISFDMNKNILDLSVLIREISSIEDGTKVQEINEYLEKELGYINPSSITYDKVKKESTILSLLESEVKGNLSILLGRKDIIMKVGVRETYSLQDILHTLDDESFRNLKTTGGRFLTIKKLKVSEYEKFEKELIDLGTPASTNIIELYKQFKMWNKCNSLFEMRVDEYRGFREIILEELDNNDLITLSLF